MHDLTPNSGGSNEKKCITDTVDNWSLVHGMKKSILAHMLDKRIIYQGFSWLWYEHQMFSWIQVLIVNRSIIYRWHDLYNCKILCAAFSRKVVEK